MAGIVAALDQGTTSTRCLLVNEAGHVLGAHQMEHEQRYPKPGWVEHDALEIWQRTQDVVRGALEKAGVSGADVAAVGITNQRETTLVWDRKTGAPFHPAVVWQDMRTDTICNQLAKDGGSDRFRERTGLPLATYFSGPKIRWLLDEVSGLRNAAERGDAIFGNMDTWLIWNLTGGAHVTDVTNASRTQLMNLETLDWDPEILEVLGIPRAMLPEIRPSSDPAFYGTTSSSGPFGAEVPVCGDLGDQQAALYGQTCFDPGEAKNTYGTGCFLLMNTGTEVVPSRSGLLTTVAYQIGDAPAVYALEGSIAIAGALVQWLRDNLGLAASSAEVGTLAESVDDNGGMYIVPAFSGLFAPRWRSDARGVMVGLTRFIRKEHIARASFEATAYQTREVLDAMRKDSDVSLSALKVDGGMVVSDLLMQFQSDILDVSVVRPKVNETTSLGAAYAAGLAVGVWSGENDLRKNWAVDRTWTPRMASAERDRLYAGWQKAVERTLDWVEP